MASLCLLYALIIFCGCRDKLTWSSCSFLLCALTMFWLHALNRSKITQCEREGITPGKAQAFSELGDGSPLYRYVQYSLDGPPARSPTDHPF